MGAPRRWLFALKAFAWLVLCAFGAPMSVRGARAVLRRGSVLVVSNHISNSDPILVQFSCPRHLRFLARREIFSMGRLGRFVTWFGAVPITQSSADFGALKQALKLLRAGEAVCIFPEGQLSPDGRLLELFPGVALLALRSGAPVQCIGIRGTNALMPHPEVKPRWAGRWLVGSWGEPRTFSVETPEAEVMAWINSELRRLSGQ